LVACHSDRKQEVTTASNQTEFDLDGTWGIFHLYKKYKRKLKIEQRKLSKKFQKGKPQSNNYKKQLEKVSKLHYKIACIRQDALHKLTTYLAKNHSQVVIEDLNVSGMSKNRKLASAILDGGFYEFRRQLEYKTDWYGSELVVADRFSPVPKCVRIVEITKKQEVNRK